MAGHFQQHVQVGINDTPLTNAIENGMFKEAEKLIIENTDAHFLNDGPYDKIPLVLVLSSDSEYRKHPRHLKLAWQLVQNGADTNLRIPEMDFVGASASPIEELVTYYLAVKDYCRNKFNEKADDMDDLMNAIGLNDEENLSEEELRDQLLELIDFFLGAGADPNGTTTMGNASLFHMVLAGSSSPDLPLVKKLCEAGADVNLTNVHGTTPVMDLVLCEDTDEAIQVMDYLWQRTKALDIMCENCVGESALWRAMFVGHSSLAVHLLERGAPSDHRAVVECHQRIFPHNHSLSTPPYPHLTTYSSLSALFAPALHDSRPFLRFATVHSDSSYASFCTPTYFHKLLLDKIIASAVSPVVDLGHLNCAEQHEELANLLAKNSYYPHLSQPQTVRTDSLIPLMFGRLSAGLRQLCVREVLNHIVFEVRSGSGSLEFLKSLSKKEDPKLELTSSEPKGSAMKKTDVLHKKLAYHLNPQCITSLVQMLGLPSGLRVFFEVEAAKCQLSAVLHLHESVDCTQNCEGDSDESLNDLSEWEEEDEEEGMGSDILTSNDEEEFGHSSSFELEVTSSDPEWEEDEGEDSEKSDEAEKVEGEDEEDSSTGGDDGKVENTKAQGKLKAVVLFDMSGDENDELNEDDDKEEDKTDPSTEEVPSDIPRENYEAFQNDSCDAETPSDGSAEKNSPTL